MSNDAVSICVTCYGTIPPQDPTKDRHWKPGRRPLDIPRPTTWLEFVRWIQRKDPDQDQKGTAGSVLFSLVRLREGTTRADSNVEAVSGWALDLDHLTELDVRAVFTRLAEGGLAFLAYTSHNHKPGSPRWRVVGPLSREVGAKEWPSVWRAFVERYAPSADAQCKDPSRAYYLPKASAQWVDMSDGEPLDVDALIGSRGAEPVSAARRVDLNAPEVVRGKDGSYERCPPGTNPITHAERLAQTMPPAISGQGGHLALLSVARAIRWGLDLDENQCRLILRDVYNARCEPPWSDTELDHKVDAAGQENGAPFARGALLPPRPVDYGPMLICGDRGAKAIAANVATVLSFDPDWDGVLGFDTFKGRTHCLRVAPMREQDTPTDPAATIGEWTEPHTTRLRTWFSEQPHLGFEPSKDAANAAIDLVARRNEFHPVRDYLNGLRWDGVARIDRWLIDYVGATAQPERYITAIGPKFLISAVARVMAPGSKVDTIPIFEGPQGKLKSSMLRALAVNPEWFTDSQIEMDSKDGPQNIVGVWIVELGELHALNRSEMTAVKAFASRAVDRYRPSYGTRAADFPRQCVFAGTTNEDKYLSDTTGNRRFWPVACGEIKLAELAKDRDQLWAEALVRYRAGAQWWLTGEEQAAAAEQQTEREAADTWEERIEHFASDKESFTLSDVLACLGLAVEHQSPTAATRAGKILAKLGWRAVPGPRTSGSRLRVYRRKSQ
jgi:hypothetical protein